MGTISKLIERRVGLKSNILRSDDILAAFSHLLMVPAALAGTIILLTRAAGNPRAFFAGLLYGAAMIFTFSCSAVYHGLKPSTLKKLFRVLDHCSIYVLIAGTYTPFSMAMPERVGTLLLVSVWSLALIGVVLKILLWGRFKALHMLIYLGMGWLVVFFWRPLSAAMDPRLLLWMLAGGLFYTVGVFFFINKRVPHSHVIWHFFVLAGAICMYLGVYFFAIPG